MPSIFQVGTIAGLVQGIYDGNMDIKTLELHGDIGLGTFNGIDGEMIAVDGIFYRIDADGKAEIANPDTCTPFAVVTKSKPTLIFSLDNVNNIQQLNSVLDEEIPTPNIFYMMQIEAEIEWIKFRSEPCQSKPYLPLAEILPKVQNIFELSNLYGTLITSRCPSFSTGMAVTGYHHHFISKDKTTGGHVFDLKLKKAKVSVTQTRRFSIALISSDEFDQANLLVDTESALKITE